LAIELNSRIVEPLGAIFSGVSAVGQTDRHLLERYALRRDESAFATLVDRHGPAVLRCCRALLGDDHEAADAFQAVFLVLARKAGSLRVRDSLAPWLRDVARKVAAHARADAARRRRHESRQPARVCSHDPSADDSGAVVREEVGRLPSRYREAVELCDLEGLTHEEAARHLGWPVGTVKSRQARGRDRLRTRLTARGLAPASLALLAARSARAGVVPPSLARATVLNATAAANAGTVPTAAAALASGVLGTMLYARLRAGLFATLSLVGLVAGVGLAYALPVPPDDSPTEPQRPSPPGRPLADILSEAARAVVEADDASSRVFALIEIARAQTRAGDPAAARVTLRKASEVVRSLGPGARCSALAAIAWSLDAAGDRENGLADLRMAVLDAAEIGSEYERLRALRTLGTAQADLGDVMVARSTARSIHAAAAAETGPWNRYNLSIPLIELLAYLGDFEEAFRVIETFDDEHLRERGLLLGELARATTSPALWYLQPRRSYSPDERRERLDILQRIEAIVAPLEQPEVRPDVELAIALATLGDFEAALRVARRFGEGRTGLFEAIDRTAKPYILSVIASHQARAGELHEARRTVREALALIEAEPVLAAARSGQVASAQASVGDLEGALKTIEGASLAERARCLTAFAELEERSGDREKARLTYRRALDAARALLEDPAPRVNPSDIAIRDAEGRVIGPQTTVERMTAVALAQIAETQAKMGAIPAAVETCESIRLPDHRRSAASKIARAHVEAGDPAAALAWALGLKSAAERVAALQGLAEGVATRAETD
jgi:RNA polymerase sigma factor (sigma-70 family)